MYYLSYITNPRNIHCNGNKSCIKCHTDDDDKSDNNINEQNTIDKTVLDKSKFIYDKFILLKIFNYAIGIKTRAISKEYNDLFKLVYKDDYVIKKRYQSFEETKKLHTTFRYNTDYEKLINNVINYGHINKIYITEYDHVTDFTILNQLSTLYPHISFDIESREEYLLLS